jgi:hypothetical protein
MKEDLKVMGDVDITGDVAITGTFSTGSMLGTAVTAENGDGAVGTGGFCNTYRYNAPSGDIITEIHVDLTGLGSSGTANDVIGNETPGTDPAYIHKVLTASDGMVYKVEMICMEVPVTGDADVILVQGSAADESFDDTVANTATVCDGTGDWTLGQMVAYTTAALTPNYYLYLTQGASDNAGYTAGQFLIRLYGHAAITA